MTWWTCLVIRSDLNMIKATAGMNLCSLPQWLVCCMLMLLVIDHSMPRCRKPGKKLEYPRTRISSYLLHKGWIFGTLWGHKGCELDGATAQVVPQALPHVEARWGPSVGIQNDPKSKQAKTSQNQLSSCLRHSSIFRLILLGVSIFRKARPSQIVLPLPVFSVTVLGAERFENIVPVLGAVPLVSNEPSKGFTIHISSMRSYTKKSAVVCHPELLKQKIKGCRPKTEIYKSWFEKLCHTMPTIKLYGMSTWCSFAGPRNSCNALATVFDVSRPDTSM